MRHGSLFSGIGGFDLAAEWAGWENMFHCEWNEFGQKVLKHYWPKSESYGDITKTDFTKWRGQIDIISGGFPCQPYSMAGKRKGTEDSRHLWPEMLRAIREVQPTWIVGENVPGLVNWSKGLVFEQVQIDLENEGYETIPFLLPACSVNAPHKRERVWFIAYRYNSGDTTFRSGTDGKQSKEIKERQQSQSQFSRYSKYGLTPNSTSEGHNNRQSIGTESTYSASGNIRNDGYVADTSNEGLQGGKLNGAFDKETENGGKQPSRSVTEFHEITDWQNFPTQSPLCSRNDGISSRLAGITFPKFRNESIKAYGNAIVPQVVFQIFKAIEQFNNLNQ